MATFYVNNEWLSTIWGIEYGSESEFNDWWSKNKNTWTGPELKWEVNAFGSVTNALESGKVASGDNICLLSNSSIAEGYGLGIQSSYISTDFTVSTAGDGEYNLTLKPSLLSGNDNQIDVAGTMTLESGITCTSNYTIDLANDGGLALDGASLTAPTISGDGSVSVTNGATLTVTGTFGCGELILDGTGTLDIARWSNPLPSITFDASHVSSDEAILYNNILTLPGNSPNYVAALGDSYDSAKLQVFNKKLYYAPAANLYVNSNFATSGRMPTSFDLTGKCFSSLASALSAATADNTIVVTGGTYSVAAGSAVAFNGVATQISAKAAAESNLTKAGDTATFSSAVAGGFIASDTYDGDISLTINGGSFAKLVTGGDFVASGRSYRTGDISLTINGGSFANTVGGGMAYVDKSTSAYDPDPTTLKGNINFTITGGTFTRRIYGGNICNNGYGAQIKLIGNVNLTIDAQKDISFSNHIVAGSFDAGLISGSTKVTFKGDGSKLTFTNTVLGGSGATYYSRNTATGVRTLHSYVTGTRTIAFDGFQGDFNGEIKAFSNASFTNGTTVAFKNTSLDLSAIEAWEFEAGSTLSAASVSFDGDTINLNGTGWSVGQALAYGNDLSIANTTVVGGTLEVVANTDTSITGSKKLVVASLAS